MIEGTSFENAELVDIILKSDGGIFNNAAQVFNHTFYFMALKPRGGGKPRNGLHNALVYTFGSFENFKEEFSKAGATLFGSGWVWLVVDEMGKLKIITTQNAQTPITKGLIPLLVCDLWEHSYYIDYRNSRVTYLDKWWNLINWTFVSRNYERISALFKPNYIDECNENSAICNYIHDLIDEERTVS